MSHGKIPLGMCVKKVSAFCSASRVAVHALVSFLNAVYEGEIWA